MSYYESRLKISFDDPDDIKKKLEVYEKLGVKNIILEYQHDNRKSNLELNTNLWKITKINIYYRVNLKPINVEDFKKKIKLFNNFPNIISVESLNKEIQIQAARDSRVDILSFSDQGILKTLTPGIMSLIKQNSSFMEFSLSTIMEKNKALQSKNFRNLFRFIHLALKLNVNFIISGNFDNVFDFRHPRALVSVCHTLLEMPLVAAKKAFSVNPKLLVERALSRNSKNHIEEGVRLIKNTD